MRKAIVASLGLHIITLGSLALLIFARPSSPPATPLPSRTIAAGGTAAGPVDAASPTVPPDDRPSFSPMSEGNLAPWIEQFRLANVPDSVLARLAQVSFEEDWQGRLRELQFRYQAGLASETELERLNQRHDSELEQAMQLALGNERFRAWDQPRQLRSFAHIPLSPEEADQLYAQRKELNRRLFELASKLQEGTIDNEEYGRQQTRLENWGQQELQRLLGKNRYQQWEHPSADNSCLRQNLHAIKSDDVQYAALLEADRRWDEQRTTLEENARQGETSDYTSQLQAIDAARNQQYREVLGSEGVERLKQQEDSRYRAMKRFSAAWQLNEADIDYVYKVFVYYDQTAQEYLQEARETQKALRKDGGSVDWDDVQHGTEEFTQEMAQILRSYLGDARFEKLRVAGLICARGEL